MDNCSIVTRPGLQLVGISYSGPYSALPDESIRLQAEFLSRKHELAGEIRQGAMYCPYFGNEAFATYWAAAEWQELEEVPQGMVSLTIPERSYAVVQTTNKRIGEGYEQLKLFLREKRLEKAELAVSIEIFYLDERIEESHVDLLLPICL